MKISKQTSAFLAEDNKEDLLLLKHLRRQADPHKAMKKLEKSASRKNTLRKIGNVVVRILTVNFVKHACGKTLNKMRFEARVHQIKRHVLDPIKTTQFLEEISNAPLKTVVNKILQVSRTLHVDFTEEYLKDILSEQEFAKTQTHLALLIAIKNKDFSEIHKIFKLTPASSRSCLIPLILKFSTYNSFNTISRQELLDILSVDKRLVKEFVEFGDASFLEALDLSKEVDQKLKIIVELGMMSGELTDRVEKIATLLNDFPHLSEEIFWYSDTLSVAIVMKNFENNEEKRELIQAELKRRVLEEEWEYILEHSERSRIDGDLLFHVLKEVIEEIAVKPQLSQKEKDAALWISSHAGDESLVRKALQLGADPNTQNDNGMTALIIVCKKGYFDVAKLLIKNGANPKVIRGTHQHQTPLAEAMLNPNIPNSTLSVLQEADNGFTKEVIYCKLLAHYFSLDGKVQVGDESFYTTGFRPRHVLPQYRSNAKRFYGDLSNTAGQEMFLKKIMDKLDDHTKEKLSDDTLRQKLMDQLICIQEVMSDSLDYREKSTEELLQQLENEKPVALYGLAKSGGTAKTDAPQLHAWSVVITKGEQEGLYCVHRCNKGFGKGAHPGIAMGQCEKKSVEEVITRFKAADKWKEDEDCNGRKFLTGFTDNYLLQNNKKTFRFLRQKSQKVGNCTVANLNSMERALIYAMLKPTLGALSAERLARIIQKTRTNETRFYTLKDYLELHSPDNLHPYPINVGLLKSIMQKLQRKPKCKSVSDLLNVLQKIGG